jgi:hypothetical protein
MNQRNVTDRRTRQQKRHNDRRVRPDRRLNNISVEWIPFSEVYLRPAIRKSLCRTKSRDQSCGSPRRNPLTAAPYENQWSPMVDRRNVTDRRTRQESRPYTRRIQPDRRLNSIFVEWIPLK